MEVLFPFIKLSMFFYLACIARGVLDDDVDIDPPPPLDDDDIDPLVLPPVSLLRAAGRFDEEERRGDGGGGGSRKINCILTVKANYSEFLPTSCLQ
jgi:hypothetical protein